MRRMSDEDGSLADNSHHGHPEQVTKAHGQQLDRGEVASEDRRGLKFLGDGTMATVKLLLLSRPRKAKKHIVR
jgi:hypothetical protein